MKACVTFVGAGPGAEDLITLRGLRALEQADLVLYAGSLVNPALLANCKKDCLCRDSASLSLDAQIEMLSQAALAGKYVVRLHTGDPALYGAINEQIRLLDAKGVTASIVPGVSSVFAAAAALGTELTSPGASQSVVLTRTPGRTPMPESEDAALFASTGATLVFFLSAGNADAIMRRLMHEGGLAADTPAAAVYRASWPDERIVRGVVSDIATKIREAGFGRQALIFVGRALADGDGASRLYAADFSHGYRNHLESEAFTGRCAIYAFTRKGLSRAREIAAGLGLPTTIRCTHADSDANPDAYTPAKELDAQLAADWHSFDALIFIGAAGIAVRKIAPLLQDKTSDPAVVTCAETGAHVISLTAGHLGGANRLARRVARILGGQAVISTGTDSNGLPAFDEIAAQEHARILNAAKIHACNAALLQGKSIAFCGPQSIYERYFARSEQIVFAANPATVTAHYAVRWDTEAALPEGVTHLDVSSRSVVLGLGCRRGVALERLLPLVEGFLAAHSLTPQNVAGIATCDIKADEAAVLQLGKRWQCPVAFYTAEELANVQTPSPSEKVRAMVGTASVCEAACLLSAGYGQYPAPTLCAPKEIFADVTLALARLPHLRTAAKTGRVTVAGIGSGAPGQLTPDVAVALRRCDTVAGYSRYLDLVRERIHGKNIIQSGMTGEMERCLATLEAAHAGRDVCMVCSGDPGILAMAGLLFELRGREPRFADLEIHVLPGITAASTAAATLGAPFQNGFALVSLSDLLTDTEEVRQNLKAIALSALPVALYNPAGKKRRQLLAETLAIFRQQRGGQTLCAYVKNAGRPQESKWIGILADFPANDVDMSTLVVIGGPHTLLDDGVLYEARGYMKKYANDDATGDTAGGGA